VGPYGFVMITVFEEHTYQVVLGNFILNHEALNHKERLETVNNLEMPELKDYYNNIISNTEISERGGAGLGLVDMAIKSENKLRYQVYEYDSEKSLFTLNITLNETKQLA
jgi:ribosomal protein L5